MDLPRSARSDRAGGRDERRPGGRVLPGSRQLPPAGGARRRSFAQRPHGEWICPGLLDQIALVGEMNDGRGGAFFLAPNSSLQPVVLAGDPLPNGRTANGFAPVCSIRSRWWER